MTPEEKAANVALLARVVMQARITHPSPGHVGAYMPSGHLSEKDKLFGRLHSLEVIGEYVALSRWEGMGNVHVWDPYTSIADAMEMLDKFEQHEVIRAGRHGTAGTWFLCRIFWPGKAVISCEAPSRLGAICAACLEWAQVQGEKK